MDEIIKVNAMMAWKHCRNIAILQRFAILTLAMECNQGNAYFSPYEHG